MGRLKALVLGSAVGLIVGSVPWYAFGYVRGQQQKIATLTAEARALQDAVDECVASHTKLAAIVMKKRGLALPKDGHGQ